MNIITILNVLNDILLDVITIKQDPKQLIVKSSKTAYL